MFDAFEEEAKAGDWLIEGFCFYKDYIMRFNRLQIYGIRPLYKNSVEIRVVRD